MFPSERWYETATTKNEFEIILTSQQLLDNSSFYQKGREINGITVLQFQHVPLYLEWAPMDVFTSSSQNPAAEADDADKTSQVSYFHDKKT